MTREDLLLNSAAAQRSQDVAPVHRPNTAPDYASVASPMGRRFSATGSPSDEGISHSNCPVALSTTGTSAGRPSQGFPASPRRLAGGAKLA